MEFPFCTIVCTHVRVCTASHERDVINRVFADSVLLCVIDGGPEEYKGQGTSLPFHPLSLDRQHAVKWPQHHAHGVGFRESTDKPYHIRLDRLPDGNQDVYFGESDEELDARLWGSWDSPQALHECWPETGWRDTLPDDDITGMPRPWTHKQTDIFEMPPQHRDPSPGPPEIPLEVELAAAGVWAGYVLEPGWTRHADAIAEYRKAVEWATVEPVPPKKAQRKTKAASKKADKERTSELLRRTQEIIKAHWADIRKHPVYVRAVVDGATHESAVAAAAAATPETAARIAMGADVTEGLEMQETPDHLVKGEVNPPNAEGKTMAVNLALYSVAPYNCSYLSPKATIAEHEELYHYLMTENHREGRYTDFNSEIAATHDIEYRLRPLRERFPRLMALYRPLWTKRKYGEEFSGPRDPKDEIDDALFTVPGEALPWSRERTTNRDGFSRLSTPKDKPLSPVPPRGHFLSKSKEALFSKASLAHTGRSDT
ncbi:hypothetical protein cyc_08374 [Cyclospora cayetanensis]|uniref:Uncharacterized protein n=1 Tax=Cyclospora cayetanensis TaxID=88456 RepID=A0A1D3D0U7_9EIME|nr:hypothetical protein cyc_08374 [Cyclospora cayetanensis]